MAKIKLTAPDKPIDADILIGGSKSISNRALIIRALCNTSFTINNLSSSDDTRILDDLLSSDTDHYDCGHAGTSFRFLLAFLAVKKGEQFLTGSSRMLERPILPLVKALNKLGADIEYAGKEGFPPLRIKNFKEQVCDEVTIDAEISSQFASALCMISPVLPKGLIIKLEGNPVSLPYLNMTLKMMMSFGIQVDFIENKINIKIQEYQPKDYEVESDWSSASYLYAIAALGNNAVIRLNNYLKDSTQGDSMIQQIMDELGVRSSFYNHTLRLESTNRKASAIEYDFIEQPDLFQAIAVVCAGKRILLEATGLQTLMIKETNRIEALKIEFEKIGMALNQIDYSGSGEKFELNGNLEIDLPEFEDYGDHRMIMSLACLAMLSPVVLNNPGVVSKSYPNFWKDLETMGFKISIL